MEKEAYKKLNKEELPDLVEIETWKIAQVDNQIKALRKIRAKHVHDLKRYRYHMKSQNNFVKTQASMVLFGKRRRDLSKEEMKEYNRIKTRESRKRLKEANDASKTKDN